MIRIVIEAILWLMNKFVPDGMKVYVLGVIGIVAGLALMSVGDFVNGGMLLWGGLLGLAGRHTAEKLMEGIKDNLTHLAQIRDMQDKALDLPELPVPDMNPQTEEFLRG